MKVLFVANDPSIFEKASASRVRMRAYAAAIGELHIVSRAPRGARTVTEGPLTLHPIGMPRTFHFVPLAWRAWRLCRKEDIEVISAQDPFEYGLVACGARLRTRAALHLQLHTDPFTPAFARFSFTNRLRTWLMRFVVFRAARMRVVARSLREALIVRCGLAPERVSVLPMYTDLMRFRSLSRAPERGRLLWIGRFEKEKDPLLALETLAAIRAAGMDARLTMLGVGRLQRTLAARAKVRGLGACLELAGHSDPAPYFARTELLLTTSYYEGYGLAMVEALAARCPVFSTDVGVAREVGAAVASSRATYPKEAAQFLERQPPTPPPIADPYSSFEDYVTAYADDLRACYQG